MNLTYHEGPDGLLYPDVIIPGDEKVLGKYGRLRQKYLLAHKSRLVQALVIKGQWWEHLWEIDETAQLQIDQMVAAMAKQDGTDEALKERDPLRWVGLMNNYLNSAEETVLHDLIYT
jgi:hypothetical protein